MRPLARVCARDTGREVWLFSFRSFAGPARAGPRSASGHIQTLFRPRHRPISGPPAHGRAWEMSSDTDRGVAVEARNLAPLPGDVDFTVGASVAMPGLTAWQGLFEHGRLQAGQSVLVHGAAGAVGSMVTQLAREAGAYVIGTGRASHRQTALDFGAKKATLPEGLRPRQAASTKTTAAKHRGRPRRTGHEGRLLQEI